MVWWRAPELYLRIALVAWLVSLAATTGYASLLPLWLLLRLVLNGRVGPGGRSRAPAELPMAGAAAVRAVA